MKRYPFTILGLYHGGLLHSLDASPVSGDTHTVMYRSYNNSINWVSFVIVLYTHTRKWALGELIG